MKFVSVAISPVQLLVLFSLTHTAIAQTNISLDAPTVFAVPRSFGAQSVSTFALNKFITSTPAVTPNMVLSFPMTQDLAVSTDRFKPRAIVSGYPLVRAKGIVKGRGVLFISDSGKGGAHDEPARIWRFNPQTRELALFYQGPLLVHSKWLFYREGQAGTGDELIVSDYGVEPTPRSPSTGEGAKVFAIPVNPDNSAGAPRVIHSGPPLHSPEGITVIGETVILADWSAGPLTARPETPNVLFSSGVVWAIPLGGGLPQRIFEDVTFTTLIAACIYNENENLFLRLIDIDGGRYQVEKTDPFDLPYSGIAKFYRAKVESAVPLRLGTLEELPLTEDIPVPFVVTGVSASDTVVIQGRSGARFEDDDTVRTFSGSAIGADGKFSVIARSPLSNDRLDFNIQIVGPGVVIKSQRNISVPKDAKSPITVQNNKHAGAVAYSRGLLPTIAASADGSSRTLSLFATNGGTPATLWQGPPFVSPMGTQFSWDATKLWVTDQYGGPNGTAAVFELDLPLLDELSRMFPKAVRGIR